MKRIFDILIAMGIILMLDKCMDKLMEEPEEEEVSIYELYIKDK